MPKHIENIPGYSRLAATLDNTVEQSIWIGAARVSVYSIRLGKCRAIVDAPPAVPIWRGTKFEEATGATPETAFDVVGPFYIEVRCGNLFVRDCTSGLFRTATDANELAKTFDCIGYRICNLFTGNPVRESQ